MNMESYLKLSLKLLSPVPTSFLRRAVGKTLAMSHVGRYETTGGLYHLFSVPFYYTKSRSRMPFAHDLRDAHNLPSSHLHDGANLSMLKNICVNCKSRAAVIGNRGIFCPDDDWMIQHAQSWLNDCSFNSILQFFNDASKNFRTGFNCWTGGQRTSTSSLETLIDAISFGNRI
jgi:hypothetical protein